MHNLFFWQQFFDIFLLVFAFIFTGIVFFCVATLIQKIIDLIGKRA